jgi:hypothetical protein
LGRAPDAAGLQYWVHALESGDSLTNLASSFLTSAEGQAIYGTAISTSPDTDATFITTLYQEVLGRTPDTTGAQYWAGQLESGALTPAGILTAFLGSPEAQARDATPVTSFLLAAGEGTANYGGNLYAVSSSIAASAVLPADTLSV